MRLYQEKNCARLTGTNGALNINGRQVWAVVPVKGLERAKSRLSPRLSPPQRATLMLNMVERTLTTLKGLELSGVMVVSPDPTVLRLAETVQVCGVDEKLLGLPPQKDQLNTSLNTVVHRLANEPELPATDLLILPADLPLLTKADLDALLQLAGPGRAVLATDLAGRGTNALLLDLVTARHFDFSFGPNSFNLHRQTLQNLGLEVVACDRPGLRFDLDYPSDFERLPLVLRQSLI